MLYKVTEMIWDLVVITKRDTEGCFLWTLNEDDLLLFIESYNDPDLQSKMQTKKYHFPYHDGTVVRLYWNEQVIEVTGCQWRNLIEGRVVELVNQ